MGINILVAKQSCSPAAKVAAPHQHKSSTARGAPVSVGNKNAADQPQVTPHPKYHCSSKTVK